MESAHGKQPLSLVFDILLLKYFMLHVRRICTNVKSLSSEHFLYSHALYHERTKDMVERNMMEVAIEK